MREIAAHRGVTATVSFAEAYSFEAGRAEMLRLLQNPCAEAYFCGDDVLSIGALSALQSAGKQVPDDIGLIGLNDMKMAGWANINLTTIHNPFPRIIDASIDRIAALIGDSALPPKVQLFEGHVVERGTLRAVQV